MIVVTGANGNLGRQLLRELSGRQAVRGVVRSKRAAAQIKALDLIPEPEIRVVDYLDQAAMNSALAGASHVVHLVGILKEASHNSYADAHQNSSRVLCAAAREAGVDRIIYLSILGSHPDSPNECLASKGAAEGLLMQAATPALVVRVPMVLGPGDYASAALGRRAKKRWSVLLRASSYEQPIYAGDVIQAIISGIGSRGLDDVAVDLAGPTSLSRGDLIRRAAAMLGRSTRVVSLPLGIGLAFVSILERLLVNPAVTRAMLEVLDHDDRIDPEPGRRLLGIELTRLDVTLAKCLEDSSV
ncbi:MAG: NAD(P)H-binding protein [Gammaproteobacteria bacterium]|nr:NAD(P)H-binding protein [Gammaproteobacteria bacterium]